MTIEIELDPGSFNRKERLELQAKYGRHFDELVEFVDGGMIDRRKTYVRASEEDGGAVLTVMPPDAPKPLTKLDGSPAFADDVLIDMLLVVRRRTHPETPASFFDNLTYEELLGTVAGKAPAAPAKKKPAKKRPAKKRAGSANGS